MFRPPVKLDRAKVQMSNTAAIEPTAYTPVLEYLITLLAKVGGLPVGLRLGLPAFEELQCYVYPRAKKHSAGHDSYSLVRSGTIQFSKSSSQYVLHNFII